MLSSLRFYDNIMMLIRIYVDLISSILLLNNNNNNSGNMATPS